MEERFYRNMYTLALGVDNLCIDLPPEDGSDVTKYNATLGHKENHSFEPNTEYHIFTLHPILGTTKILVAATDIFAGTESTVNYEYKTSTQKPSWYVKQLKEFVAKKEAMIIK